MSATDTRQPTVSVVVPVRNGAEDLRELISALERQTLPRDHFEVVVADDGSTDMSYADLVTTDEFVRILPGPPLNSYAARNRAALAARGEVIAFCDADCRPEPDWLLAGLAALGSADVVAGRIRFILPERYTSWSLVDMELFKNQERQVRAGVAETANLFVSRDFFLDLDGFDGTVAEYGDFDFVERAVGRGGRLVYAPEAVVWHPVRTSGRSTLRALWIYGCGYGERVARAGGRPYGLRPTGWVPFVRTVRGRMRVGKPLGLDRTWLNENGVEPTRRETLAALSLIYVVEPYLRNAAHVRGWWRGRARRA